MIKNTTHCLTCENKRVDFTTGVYCSISGEKPKFIEKCSSIEFGETLEKKIVKLNSNLKLIENNRTGVYLHLYTFLTIAFIVLIADSLFINYLWNITYNRSLYISSYYIVAVPIIIASVGLFLIPYSINPSNKFKSQLKIARSSISEFDSVLNIYNIQYKVDTKLIKGPHDIIDIESRLEILKNNKKDYSIKVNTTNAKITIDY